MTEIWLSSSHVWVGNSRQYKRLGTWKPSSTTTMFSSSRLLALSLLAPSLVAAGLFPPDSVVKMLDPKGFKKALKPNQTIMVAFVAPWCGHCQRMGPEFSQAALGLYPLLPTYAVDCDNDQNKRLCAEQDVKGFPTVILFPRGKTLPPMTYDSGERTASAFFYWASRRIPNTVKKLYKVEDIKPWVEESSTSGKPRALLLTKDKKVPLLWKVLGNKYKDQIELATHRDRKGKSSVALGYEAGEKKQPKVLIYPIGATQAVRYEGINKLDSLSKFFDSVLDGTADLTIVNEQAAAEEFVLDEKELEIEQKQEAQRIALAHGGFSDLIDFEAAIKNGAGADYHDTHGYGGMMGGVPKKKSTAASEATSAEPHEATGAKPAEPAVAAGEDKAQVVLEGMKKTGSRPPPAGECTAAPLSDSTGDCQPPSNDRPKDEL
ncbi:protein disulfide isomerase [Mycena floridula]|nr:protein disulfide isomerase [Mycena floridula]